MFPWRTELNILHADRVSAYIHSLTMFSIHATLEQMTTKSAALLHLESLLLVAIQQ